MQVMYGSTLHYARIVCDLSKSIVIWRYVKVDTTKIDNIIINVIWDKYFKEVGWGWVTYGSVLPCARMVSDLSKSI